MTKDDRIASYKYSVLQHTRKHKNITYTCKALNVSRTIYYKWLKRFSQFGYLCLLDKEKSNHEGKIQKLALIPTLTIIEFPLD
jgi:transposase